MSKKPPPQVLFNFQEEDINEKIEADGEDFVYEDEQGSAPKGQEELIKIEEKEQIISKDIFDDMPDNIGVIPDEVKEVLMEEGVPLKKQNLAVDKKPVKDKGTIEKQTKKKRKPMSEEHKQKLALAREKAMIVRKAKAEEKKKMKELDKEEKELLKTQKIKRVKKLKEDVDSDDAEVQKSKPSPSMGVTTFTKKDLEDAQYDAIMKYDAVRKQRKKEKKEAEMVERDKQKMLNTIQKATGSYKYRDGSNRWDNCY